MKTLSLLLCRFWLAMLALAIQSPGAHALTIGPDVAGYSASDSVSGFGFIDISATGAVLSISTVDDSFNGPLPLGFSFAFYGASQTQCFVSSNGLITFGAGNPQYVGDLSTPLDSNVPTLAVWLDDLFPGNSTGIRYQTVGSAPNRTFVVQWTSRVHYSFGGGTITFQAQLHEGSNAIAFIYPDTVFGNAGLDNGASATVGIRDVSGNTNGRFLQWSINSAVITNGTTLVWTDNRAPNAVDNSFAAPVSAPPFTFDVLADDTDPDNDALTITGVTNGAHGTVSTDGATLTYTPGPGYHGNDIFTYTIGDGSGLTDTATVTIYQAPDVLTLAATTVIPTAAILNAVANPRDLSTDVGFQYSIDPGLAGAVLSGTVNVGSGSTDAPAGIAITGLMPNTRYYYRALAASSAGASTGTIESFLTPVVVWGGAGSNAQTGTLDATIIPGTTSTPIRYANASNQGYDIVASTAGLGGAGLGSIVGTPGWWFEGRAPNVSGYATTTFRFLDADTNAAVGVTGVRFRLEDAEFTERFANFSYWDALGNKITVNFNNSIFTYSGTPIFSAGGLAVENGVAYQGGTQMGKWIDIDLSTRAISGFEIQARRQTSSAGSVIMSAWGGGALPMNLWRQAKFGASYTDDTVAGDFADPNGDGIINLFAYAFGIEPLGPTSGGLPVVSLAGGYLRVTFSRPQSVTDLTYQVEVSGDMILWLPGSKYSASGDIASNANTTQISRTYVGPNEVIVVRDNIPAGSGSRYIRVRVTRP